MSIKVQTVIQPYDVAARLGARAQTILYGAVFAVAEWLRFKVRKTFEDNASPEGVPWAPLSPKYLLRKKGPGILRETGALWDQVGGPRAAATIDGNTVTMAATVPYASVHQEGFEGDVNISEHGRRIKQPKNDIWGRILGKGNKMTRQKIAYGVAFPRVGAHARHMKIPARPYFPNSATTENEGGAVAKQALEDGIAGSMEGTK